MALSRTRRCSFWGLAACLIFASCGGIGHAYAAMDNYPTARLRMLDKVTARTSTFDVKVDTTVRFGQLYIKPRACRKAPPIETPESAAFLQIWESTPKEKPQWIFSGWMFASSPALSAMDHPIYDVWVLDCIGDPDRPAQADSAGIGFSSASIGFSSSGAVTYSSSASVGFISSSQDMTSGGIGFGSSSEKGQAVINYASSAISKTMADPNDGVYNPATGTIGYPQGAVGQPQPQEDIPVDSEASDPLDTNDSPAGASNTDHPETPAGSEVSPSVIHDPVY